MCNDHQKFTKNNENYATYYSLSVNSFLCTKEMVSSSRNRSFFVKRNQYICKEKIVPVLGDGSFFIKPVLQLSLLAENSQKQMANMIRVNGVSMCVLPYFSIKSYVYTWVLSSSFWQEMSLKSQHRIPRQKAEAYRKMQWKCMGARWGDGGGARQCVEWRKLVWPCAILYSHTLQLPSWQSGGGGENGAVLIQKIGEKKDQ